MELLYAYLENLRKVGPQEWVFEEQKKIDELNFRFKPKENYMSYVQHLSHHMHLLRPEEMDKVLISRHVTPKFDPEGITYILDHMSPSRCNIYLNSKSNASVAD